MLTKFPYATIEGDVSEEYNDFEHWPLLSAPLSEELPQRLVAAAICKSILDDERSLQ